MSAFDACADTASTDNASQSSGPAVARQAPFASEGMIVEWFYSSGGEEQEPNHLVKAASPQEPERHCELASGFAVSCRPRVIEPPLPRT